MSQYCIQISWEDAPHLTPEAREELWSRVPPFQRQARSKGIPELGAGAIYTVPVVDITVNDFRVPPEWPRTYGLDVGWNWTAAVWLAWNRDTDTVYVWNCYKRGHAEPVVHAEAIKARGDWMRGVCDPAATAANQIDGTRLLDMYRKLGLHLEPAEHAVETGLYAVWNRLATGKLKVFASCSELFSEYSLYRRNEKGLVVKENDHCLDALRYAVMSGLQRATPTPVAQPTVEEYTYPMAHGADAMTAWMAH